MQVVAASPGISVPDEEKLGPAMLALNEQQRLFVMATFAMGSKIDNTKAARAAGYAEGKPGSAQLRVRGHKLAHDPRVQAAILEEGRKRLKVGAVAAVNLALQVIANKRAPLKDRLKAAEIVLDRGGFHALTEHRVDVTHTSVTREEKVLRVIELARLTGQDPKALIGNLADVTDADFKMVDKATAPDPTAAPA